VIAAFGEIGDPFEEKPECSDGGQWKCTRDGSDDESMTGFLLPMFMVGLSAVMSNMIVAKMNDTYTEVAEKAALAFDATRTFAVRKLSTGM
jgi:hypothetical protein